jgi:hypothetical protein
MDKQRLERDVRLELGHLEKTAEAARDLCSNVGPNPSPLFSAAAAKYVADVFMGLENLWKRRCRYLKLPVPEGPASHRDTLAQFLDDPKLGKLLHPGVDEHLGRYLRFRHRFIHGYTYDVAWSIVEEPLALIPETVAELRRVWDNWLSGLPGT